MTCLDLITKNVCLHPPKNVLNPNTENKPRIYINEHLTKKNANIARQARVLRKDGKIKSMWTRNCKIFIKTLDDDTRRVENAEVLDEY